VLDTLAFTFPRQAWSWMQQGDAAGRHVLPADQMLDAIDDMLQVCKARRVILLEP